MIVNCCFSSPDYKNQLTMINKINNTLTDINCCYITSGPLRPPLVLPTCSAPQTDPPRVSGISRIYSTQEVRLEITPVYEDLCYGNVEIMHPRLGLLVLVYLPSSIDRRLSPVGHPLKSNVDYCPQLTSNSLSADDYLTRRMLLDISWSHIRKPVSVSVSVSVLTHRLAE